MTLEYMIRAIAGAFILISLTLGYTVNPYWHLFTAFVGLNLLQSAFTHWCLMEGILKRLGLPKPHQVSGLARNVHVPTVVWGSKNAGKDWNQASQDRRISDVVK